MNKETIKAFIAWLESASVEEINQRIEEIRVDAVRRDGKAG